MTKTARKGGDREIKERTNNRRKSGPGERDLKGKHSSWGGGAVTWERSPGDACCGRFKGPLLLCPPDPRGSARGRQQGLP